MTFSRILVPTDFSPHADAAFRVARDLARRYDASIHLLHVVDGPLAGGAWSARTHPAGADDRTGEQLQEARDRLQAYLKGDAGNVCIDVRLGHAAEQILEAAQDKPIDLIVMGTHGRTGLARAMLGSVAERVVRLAPCPVLSTHDMPATPRSRTA